MGDSDLLSFLVSESIKLPTGSLSGVNFLPVGLVGSPLKIKIKNSKICFQVNSSHSDASKRRKNAGAKFFLFFPFQRIFPANFSGRMIKFLGRKAKSANEKFLAVSRLRILSRINISVNG